MYCSNHPFDTYTDADATDTDDDATLVLSWL